MKLLKILLLSVSAIVFCQTAETQACGRFRSWNQHRHHILPLRRACDTHGACSPAACAPSTCATGTCK